jgi:hypothetical protein
VLSKQSGGRHRPPVPRRGAHPPANQIEPPTPVRPPKPKVAQPKLPHPAPLPGSGVGRPLTPHIASPISRSFGIDVSSVRVHSDVQAAAAAGALGARAFTVGGHVFLGQGQRPTDMPLVAHEVAHTVQQQGAPRVQLWSPGTGSAYEQEAHRAAGAVVRNEPFTVQHRTQPRIQRLGISDALDYFADKANLIPGYRMFTLLIGVNPINMQAVERTTANFLRALIELIPGGGIVTQVLDKYGVIDHAAEWIDSQAKSLGITAASILAALKEFLNSLSWKDIFHLGDVWDRAKRIFTTPIQRLIDFGTTVIKGVLRFVREAVLAPLAALAKGTRGWDLLTAVLGEDPITGDKVPRTAETLIGGFMKLIGQEEIWENIKKARAIPRAWAWFQKALSGLVSLVSSIPDRFIAALKELDFSDFLILPSAFAKLARVFGAFVMDFLSWALGTVLDLLQIIFEVVAPGAMQYVRKAAGAFKEIVRAPIKFVGNLVAAAKLGFQNFASNFLEHLKAGLLDWLTGSLPGIYIPKGLTLPEILKFVLSVLGLTWANIRGKLVNAIGDTAVKALETGFDIVVKLVREGPAAAWEAIKEQLSNLKDMAIGAITDFVVDAVVKKALPQLIALFIPGAGFITAIVKIYDTIMVFVQKISKIIQVVTGFIDSIASIAAGAIGGAAKRVESTLANLLSLAISFLAGFIGLGKVSDKIMGVIQKIRAPIDKALDWLIGWIVTAAKRLGKLFTAKDAKPSRDPVERARQLLTQRLTGSTSDQDARKAVASVFAEVQPLGAKSLILVSDGDGYAVEIVASPGKKLASLQRAAKDAAMHLNATIVVEKSVDLRAAPIAQVARVTDPRTGLPHSQEPPWVPAGERGTAVHVAGLAAAPNVLEAISRNTYSEKRTANGTHAERSLAAFVRAQAWLGSIQRIDIVNHRLNPCTACAGELASLMASINSRRKANGLPPAVGTLTWSEPWLNDPSIRGKSPEAAVAYINGALQTLSGGKWQVTPSSIERGSVVEQLIVKVLSG